MIAPGAIARVRRRGDIAFVVHSRALDGGWRVMSKAVDGKRRSAFSSLTVGTGDIVVVKDAPAYEVGTEVEHDGLQHTVLADRGGTVTFEVPVSRYRTRGGSYTLIAAGNTITIAKSDLVLATFG